MFTARQFPDIPSDIENALALTMSADLDTHMGAASSPHHGVFSVYSAMAASGADRRDIHKTAQYSDAASASEGNLPTIPFMGKTIPGLGQ